MRILIPAAGAWMLALGACTPQPGPDAAGIGTAAQAGTTSRQCFWPSQVTGFTKGPAPDQIYVHAGPSDVFLMETMGSCPDLNFTEDIGFDTVPGGAICSELQVTLITPSTIGPRRCPVRMMRKLTPDEVAQMRRG